MPDIMLILSCLGQSIDKGSLQRLDCLVKGLLAMTGRVTMLHRTSDQWVFNSQLHDLRFTPCVGEVDF